MESRRIIDNIYIVSFIGFSSFFSCVGYVGLLKNEPCMEWLA